MNILITGGASGLGYALTSRLAEEASNTLYFTYFRSAEAAAKLEAAFPNVKAIECDFSNPDSVETLADSLAGWNLQILINNALPTGLIRKHAHRIAQDSYSRGFHENILPLLRLTHQAIKLFRKQKFGKIITVLSAGLIGTPPAGMAEYLASKAYLLSMSKSWAAENKQFNITANCISPDFMQTPLNADMDERLVEQMIETHPLKQLITPKEVAEAVFFMTRATQHMNGTNLILNAGNSMN